MRKQFYWKHMKRELFITIKHIKGGNKDEIVKLGDEIKAPMELSYSCYTGHEKHCGVCESCMRRKRAFKLADVKDPSEYNE